MIKPMPAFSGSTHSNPDVTATYLRDGWRGVFELPGIVYVGASCSLNQGREAGDIVDATGAVVGRVFWPADGAAWIKGPGMELDWNAGSLDSNADGFVNGNDQDLWMEWWVWGSPMADWDGNGFVNADDFDSRAEAWQKGTP